MKNYKAEIEKELDKFCDEILNLISDKIIAACATPESKVFFYKMQGDYCRYISEYAQGAQYDKASEDA